MIPGQQIADLLGRCNDGDGDTGTAEFRSVVAPLLPVPVEQWEWPYA